MSEVPAGTRLGDSPGNTHLGRQCLRVSANRSGERVRRSIGGSVRYGLTTAVNDARFEIRLKARIVIGDATRIMPNLFRDDVPDVTNLLQNGALCHDAFSPSSSSGVTNVGTCKPSIPLTRRMCPNLLALARCLQFQVTRKYRQRAAGRKSAVLGWCGHAR